MSPMTRVTLTRAQTTRRREIRIKPRTRPPPSALCSYRSSAPVVPSRVTPVNVKGGVSRVPRERWVSQERLMLDCVSDVLDYAWTGSRCGVALYVRPDRPAPAETDTVYADCPRIRTCVNVGPVSVDFAVRRILWGVCIQDTGYLGFCCLRIRPRIQGVSMRRPGG